MKPDAHRQTDALRETDAQTLNNQKALLNDLKSKFELAEVH